MRCCLLILLALSLPAAAAKRPAIWLEDSLVKIFPDTAAPDRKTKPPEVLVPRNGHAGLQVILRASEALEGLSIELQPPRRGHVALQTEIRRVGFVPVRNKPPKTEDKELVRVPPGVFPDPLFPLTTFALRERHAQPLLLTFYAPPNAAPGKYSGRVTVRRGSARVAAIRFQVRVAQAAVPAKQTLKVTNWFNWNERHLERHYPVLAQQPERRWELLANIGRVMAEHRQNVILTPVFPLSDAWLNNGAIRYEFARLDRFVETFDKAGLAEVIEGGHLLGRVSGYQTPMAIACDVVENGAIVRKKLPPDNPEVEAHFRRFLPALREHLREKGWLSRYVQHIHDEPHGEEKPTYVRYARLIRELLPGVPTVDAISLREGTDFLRGTLDIWTPVLASFDDQIGVLRDHVASGGQVWYYTCIFPQGPYLNRFTDYPLLKTRLLHWFNFRHDLAGFLHWGGNYWSDSPFSNVEPIINDGRTLLPAGDNAIVYPDPERLTVLSSLRLEAMREGIEDHELLVALAARNPEKARALAREAIPNFTDYIRDVAAFRNLQKRLLLPEHSLPAVER
jgi:hypothetical protein